MRIVNESALNYNREYGSGKSRLLHATEIKGEIGARFKVKFSKKSSP